MADVTRVIPPFTLPENPQPSERYRKQFNENKVGIIWEKDTHNPLVVDADEIKLSDVAQKAYNTKEHVTAFNSVLAKDIRGIMDAVEAKRLARVETSALFHKRIVYRGPIELLSPVEQKAAYLLDSKVAPLINHIESIQEDPNANAQASYMASYGDYYSKILYSRFMNDTCAGFDAYIIDPTCSLFPFFPDRSPINGMIASDISMADFKKLGQTLPANAEELRPTTVLSRDANGKIQSTPLPLYSPVKELHQKLAAALLEVAALQVDGQGLNSKVQDQLRKWAQFFTTGSAADEKAAMQATIDAGEVDGGLFRVHIGPSESYWDDNTKFPYVLQVGVRDPQSMQKLSAIAKLFPKLESSTQIPNYKPRNLSTRGGFADPMFHLTTAGFLRTFAITEPAGNNIPNYSYGTEGSNRLIWLDSLQSGLTRSKEQLGLLLVDEKLPEHNDFQVVIEYVVNHESGHLLGPQRSHITPNGQQMGAIFGAHWGDADEPKADLTNAVVTKMKIDAGDLTIETAKPMLRKIAGYSLLRYRKGKDAFLAGKLRDHTYGAVLEIAFFFKEGAMKLVNTKKGQRIKIDYPKLLAAAIKLREAIMTFQANGDLAGYQKFGQDVVSAMPKLADKMIHGLIDKNKFTFVERHL